MSNLGPIPRLETERLLLRPFCLYDAKRYFELSTHPEVLKGTDMPHRIDLQTTNEWIVTHSECWQHRKELYLLITLVETREIVGSISLFTNEAHSKADVGYWIARDQWGRGFATEACEVFIEYAFETVNLNKLEATHLLGNPASGRVLEKLGFQYEGFQRQGYFKDSRFQDVVLYGFLKPEYLKLKQG